MQYTTEWHNNHIWLIDMYSMIAQKLDSFGQCFCPLGHSKHINLLVHGKCSSDFENPVLNTGYV